MRHYFSDLTHCSRFRAAREVPICARFALDEIDPNLQGTFCLSPSALVHSIWIQATESSTGTKSVKIPCGSSLICHCLPLSSIHSIPMFGNPRTQRRIKTLTLPTKASALSANLGERLTWHCLKPLSFGSHVGKFNPMQGGLRLHLSLHLSISSAASLSIQPWCWEKQARKSRKSTNDSWRFKRKNLALKPPRSPFAP